MQSLRSTSSENQHKYLRFKRVGLWATFFEGHILRIGGATLIFLWAILVFYSSTNNWCSFRLRVGVHIQIVFGVFFLFQCCLCPQLQTGIQAGILLCGIPDKYNLGWDGRSSVGQYFENFNVQWNIIQLWERKVYFHLWQHERTSSTLCLLR